LGACARIAGEQPLPAGCITPTPPQIGGPISLLDETGAPITQAAFQGRPAIVYFGYAFCPDVCPLSLQSLNLALGQLGEAGQQIQPILISVDPERDTPAVLQRYVQSGGFPAGLRGLTGSPEMVVAASAIPTSRFAALDSGRLSVGPCAAPKGAAPCDDDSALSIGPPLRQIASR